MQNKKDAEAKAKAAGAGGGAQGHHKQGEPNLQGITTSKEDDFSEWFTQLMLKADLADYSSVSGCLVFKPSSYIIWEKIVAETDVRLKKLGIKNAYFPLLIPEKAFAKEQEHVKGFTPEVAWVTHAGDTELSERLAIRPTSEAIMYESYSKWIRSWRDLPLKINQWNNVIRWEFKHPVPFLRTREFLWNEAHNVYATEKETIDDGEKILEAYDDVCTNYLALYGIKGRKTDYEKFAGAVFSKKLHYMMPNGKVIEGPCFHYDGTNFSKAYDIGFLDETGKKQFGYQSTFAISTRMLGAMFAIHSDEKGLVLPPKVAPIQVVIVPILFDDTREKILKEADRIKEELEKNNILVHLDNSDNKPGWKFNNWELKGIPIRIELGPRDLENKKLVLARRDTKEKETVDIKDITKRIPELLNQIQNALLKKSEKAIKEAITKAKTLEETKKAVENKKIALAPFCKESECEELLKSKTSAKTLWIEEKEHIKQEKCIVCDKQADYFVYIGKTY